MGITPASDATQPLGPCPFCAKPMTIRDSVNSYGRCDTEGCWMNARAMTVPFSDPRQVDQWNARTPSNSTAIVAELVEWVALLRSKMIIGRNVHARLDATLTRALDHLSNSSGDGWRGIESAPTDETLFLIFNWNSRRRPIYDVWCGKYLAENREKIASGMFDNAPHLRWDPTHWMPLPAPPSSITTSESIGEEE